MNMANMTTPTPSSAGSTAALAPGVPPTSMASALDVPHMAASVAPMASAPPGAPATTVKAAVRPSTSASAVHATRTVENVMDELMLQYLKKRGYTVAPPPSSTVDSRSQDDVEMANAPPLLANGHIGDGHATATNGATTGAIVVKQAGNAVAAVSEDERRRFLGAERIQDEVVSLERYAQQLGLTTESCAANHILFYGLTGGDPTTFVDAYAKLTDWVCNSLDMYKYELHAVTFPVFVHCYLDLLAKGFVAAAKEFFLRFASDHMRLHVQELRHLSLMFTPDHIRSNEYAQQVLHSKFNVHVSLLSFELLNAFLSHEQLFLLLTIVNERVNLVVTANQPGMRLEQLEDAALVDGIPSLAMRSAQTSSHQAADDVARVVSTSETPNESEIGLPLTSGDYDMEYMVHMAGGKGTTLEDLHAVKVKWGVLPARKLHQPLESDGAANGGKTDEEGSAAGGVGVTNSGGTSGATGAGDTTAGSIGADTDKKNASTNGSSEPGPSDGSATGAGKTGDKTKAGDKAGAAAATTTEAQRKAKRSRLGTESDLDRRKSELDVVGPMPDRKNAFNAHIMERLVLRQPPEMKTQALEDLKVRATLSKTNLPSALCFSFANSGGAHVNNMCFSDDVTMVGASCDDGSFRVWRNDDQPLGTARGSVYHGELTETDEDEKTAVLRGHSGAVYGADFSPDNRFALTASADSTVRLWSLAAKSNVAIYRSHEGYPVWDVRFGRYGYYFASCSMDRTARLWSTDRMTPLRVFAGHLSDVDTLEFHPNHNYLATGSSDKTVRLWDIQTGKCVRIFTGHFHGVTSLAFSSNGRYLASSGDDQYINIWDLQAGKRLETLVGHRAMVTSLSFSHESTILASSGLDSTVRLWDMQSIADKSSSSSSSSGATSSAGCYVRSIHMVRPTTVQELPQSRFLLKTLRSKQTPIYKVHFTPRNLLLSGGAFLPKTES